MGQSASKQIGKTAQNVAKQVSDAAAKEANAGIAPPPTKAVSANTKPNNPARFLRGEGVATEDVRDKVQEMYLQSRQEGAEKETGQSSEMPQDLLKFIQDVGPVKQTVDADFTAPRLLEKENESELNKGESSRHSKRDRIKMPLMGQDDNFTTERNTNFSSSMEEDKKDFGVNNLELYRLVTQKGTTSDEGEISAVSKSFHSSSVNDESDWTEQEKAKHIQLVENTLRALEVPILRRDADGNIFGLHPDEVPGPEVKSVEIIPETKLKLVLKDLISSDETHRDASLEKLQQRRQSRKRSTLT